MRKVLRRRPSAAMIVAIIALVAALGGTAVAAKKLGLGSLSNGAKNKTVGVGKLTYVSTTHQAVQPEQTVTATCPTGLRAIGGGIKMSNPTLTGDTSLVLDSYPTSSPEGWKGRVFFDNPGQSATVSVACAVSRAVTGASPTG